MLCGMSCTSSLMTISTWQALLASEPLLLGTSWHFLLLSLQWPCHRRDAAVLAAPSGAASSADLDAFGAAEGTARAVGTPESLAESCQAQLNSCQSSTKGKMLEGEKTRGMNPRAWARQSCFFSSLPLLSMSTRVDTECLRPPKLPFPRRSYALLSA